MTDDSMVENETSQIRPREAIEADIESIKARESEISLKYDALTQEQKEQLDALGSRLEGEVNKKVEEITDEMLNQAISDPENPVDPEVGEFARFYLVVSHLASLNKEFTPYIKEDFEELIKEVSSRLDYDKMFDVIRVNDDDIAFSLYSGTFHLYLLRRYQHDFLLPGNEEKDHDYYSFRVYQLKKMLEDWENKGFLTDQPRPDYKLSQEFGEPIKKRRQELAQWVKPHLDELEEFNKLNEVYKPGIKYGFPFDSSLSSVYHMLDDDHSGDAVSYKEFNQIDLDPELIAAAGRHMLKVLNEHEEAGHIHLSIEVWEADKKRIDNLDLQEIIRNIAFEGFEPPEGMESVVSVEEIINELLLFLPPDFLYQLRTIAVKGKPEKIDKDDPTKETMGQYIPSYDPITKEKTHGDIAIYFKPFVPIEKEIDKGHRYVIRSTFMKYLRHELGHSAHWVMNQDEMRDWKKAIDTDDMAVSWYVAYSRKQGEARGKREDFAESFDLFLDSPALLGAISLERSEFMKVFFANRIQEGQRDGFEVRLNNKLQNAYTWWQITGQTSESIRKFWHGLFTKLEETKESKGEQVKEDEKI